MWVETGITHCKQVSPVIMSVCLISSSSSRQSQAWQAWLRNHLRVIHCKCLSLLPHCEAAWGTREHYSQICSSYLIYIFVGNEYYGFQIQKAIMPPILYLHKRGCKASSISVCVKGFIFSLTINRACRCAQLSSFCGRPLCRAESSQILNKRHKD